VTSLRRHIHRCHWLAVALIVAALFIKMLVPMGYMPSLANGIFVIQPCDSQSAGGAMMHTSMTAGDHAYMDRHDNRDHGEKQDEKHSAFDKPCAFSGLATPSLVGVDPILLATAITFIVATVFRVVSVFIFQRDTWLRPPPQGPPLTA